MAAAEMDSRSLGRSWVWLLLVGLFFSCHNVVAQGHFYATAPKSVAENQNFNVTFTLENGRGSNLKVPSFSGFTLLGGPNTSTSMQIINGSMSQSQRFTYVLRPTQQGTFTLSKASIVVDGVTLESNTLTIKVTAPNAASQAQQNQRGQGSSQQEAASTADLQKQLADDVFVKVFLSKSTVYKGEMLSATYRLYFRQNLAGYSMSKSPLLDGFWSKEVELDPNRKQTVEVVNGKQFYTVDILKYNLFPQRSGTLQIGSAEISTTAQVTVRSRSNDPFDDFFNDPFFNIGRTQNVPLTLKTNPVTVNVKELPEAGKPDGFAGAVGKFDYHTSLSAKEAKTDDPVTYSIRISGNGNLSLIDAPSLQLPSGFEVYDPKVKENISNSTSGISGSKQYDYLIIPRMPGDYKIGGSSFSYFDPSSGKYVTIPSTPFDLKITGEPSANANTGAGSSYTTQQNVSLLGEDIRYIKTGNPELKEDEGSFFGSAGFVALYAAPLLGFIGLIAVRRRNETMAADITGTKRRRALKLAKKRLTRADKHLKQNERKGFYDEVSRAIWGYLADKLNIDLSSLSKETVAARLKEMGVQDQTLARLNELMLTCDTSLYAPSVGSSEMKNDYTTALNLIADLEDEIIHKNVG